MRKDKLENYFQCKRLKLDKTSKSQLFSINIEDLILNEEILQRKFKNSKEKVLFYKDLLLSDNINHVKFAIFNSNKSLMEENLICEIINEGLIKIFFDSLEKFTEISIRYELINLIFKITTFKNTELHHFFVNENILKIYVEILLGNNYEMNYGLILILGNLIPYSVLTRNIIINHEIMDIIFKLNEDGIQSYEIINNVTWLLSNCFIDKPEPSLNFVEKCFMVFVKYAFVNHEEILKNCYWGISRITDTSYQIMNRKILENDFLINLFQTKMFDLKLLKLPIIRIIGNIYVSEDLNEINVKSYKNE